MSHDEFSEILGDWVGWILQQVVLNVFSFAGFS